MLRTLSALRRAMGRLREHHAFGRRERFFLNDGLKVLLQSHSHGVCLGKKPSFNFRPECERNGHGFLWSLPLLYGSTLI
jgi:hypothetical protein